MLKDYEHHAQYYETDQMGCIHHSNYIRWMEEARIFMMEQLGCGYRAMEEAGIISPVLEVRCQYREMVRFDEDILIQVRIREYSGVRLALSYEMRRKRDGALCTIGESSHCFLSGGRPVSLKRAKPEWDAMFRAAMKEQGEQSAPAPIPS